jgi:hypothetical protein
MGEEPAMPMATFRYFGAAGIRHAFATHPAVSTARGGRLHSPDDAQAEPCKA